MRKMKFNNRHVRLMGKCFDSKAEANWFIVLKDRERKREIIGLEHHKRFVLLTFRGQKLGTWESDFLYYEPFIPQKISKDGIPPLMKKVVDDVKGYRDKSWKRTKMLAEDSNNIEITEIPAKTVPNLLGDYFVDETNDTNREEIEEMAFEGRKIVPAGIYIGEVVKVEEQENKFDPEKPRRTWTWMIVEDEVDEFNGHNLLDWTGTSTGAKSKAGPILRALGFDTSEPIDENDVIGKRGKLVVSEEEKDGNKYNKILNVLPLSSKQKKGKDLFIGSDN